RPRHRADRAPVRGEGVGRGRRVAPLRPLPRPRHPAHAAPRVRARGVLSPEDSRPWTVGPGTVRTVGPGTVGTGTVGTVGKSRNHQGPSTFPSSLPQSLLPPS